MKLINDQFYINLEPHLDIKNFDNLHDDIIKSISKNSKYLNVSYTGFNTLFDKSYPGYFEQLRSNQNKIKDLDNQQIQIYTKLSGTVTLGQHLILRSHDNYPTSYFYKHLNKNCFNSECHKDFDFLFRWIEDQKCFTEYGRVLFWFNEPGQVGAIHRDYEKDSDRKDMFIWLTGIFPKQMIIHDFQTKEKIVIPHRAIIFNNLNWHSSIGHESVASWSLRIDGVFNPIWAEKVGIREYYNL